MKSKLVIGLVFLTPVIAFVLQNGQIVEMKLFRWHFSASLPLMVLSVLLVGVIIGALAAPSRKLRKSRLEKRSQKEKKKEEKMQEKNPVATAPAEPTPQVPVVAEPSQVESAVVPPAVGEEYPPQS
jgi:uncharacterized integral membrane protein